SVGGGIVTLGTLTMTNCTLSGDSASLAGGALYICVFDGVVSNNSVTLTNCTIAGNSAPGGQGGGIRPAAQSLSLTLNNTILANNSGGDISGVVSGNNNLVDDAGSAGIGSSSLTNGVNGNIVGVDAKLGPLQNNGGPTQTMVPLAGSPARKAG